jgi:hypothetical protein
MINTCCNCHRPKANYNCELCEEFLCKACAQFMLEDRFSFLRKVPEILSKSIYCPRCFDANVAGPMTDYDATMERAKDIAVFFKEEGKRTRFFSRKEAPYTIEKCIDKDETILRLAFLAAQDNFNSIIDVNLVSEKIVVGSHKNLIWKGTAVPCQLEQRYLNQDYQS